MRVVAEIHPGARVEALEAAARRLGCEIVVRGGRAYLVRREETDTDMESKEARHGRTTDA